MTAKPNFSTQKAAIYVRVSTHWQVDKDSLQVQRRELIAYAQMVLGIQDYVVFEDAGYSAKNTDRPDYQNMMTRMRTGEFSHLLVWKIDRISRNLLDFATMYQELKDAGIIFISKNEQFDTSNAMGEAMLKIILVFAELERNMTSERVSSVMLSRASNGQWNGGRIPYGYSYDKNTKGFLVNEQESQIVHRIFNLYEQYQSTLYVSTYMNKLGLRSKTGCEWSATSIYKILTNPFYIGAYRYNIRKGTKGHKREEDEWVMVEDHHEPIISRQQFDTIQYRLKQRRRGGVREGETYIRKNVHIFGGLLRCGYCGSNMSATIDRRRSDGWRPSIYCCGKHRKSKNVCPNKYISDTVLGPFIFNYVSNIIRAKNTIKPTTSLDVLERKLLRGDVFSQVEHIEAEGLVQIYDLLLSGTTGVEYRPSTESVDSSSMSSERTRLTDQRRKKEIALNRLKNLYLYGDESIPEKDFIVERHKIMSEIIGIDKRLEEFSDKNAASEVDSDEFIERASYFVMIENLLDEKNVDFRKYISKIDPTIPRAFLGNIINEIVVKDGLVLSIRFNNGMLHSFTYKPK